MSVHTNVHMERERPQDSSRITSGPDETSDAPSQSRTKTGRGFAGYCRSLPDSA